MSEPDKRADEPAKADAPAATRADEPRSPTTRTRTKACRGSSLHRDIRRSCRASSSASRVSSRRRCAACQSQNQKAQAEASQRVAETQAANS
jgi:hypothetical protein